MDWGWDTYVLCIFSDIVYQYIVTYIYNNKELWLEARRKTQKTQ